MRGATRLVDPRPTAGDRQRSEADGSTRTSQPRAPDRCGWHHQRAPGSALVADRAGGVDWDHHGDRPRPRRTATASAAATSPSRVCRSASGLLPARRPAGTDLAGAGLAIAPPTDRRRWRSFGRFSSSCGLQPGLLLGLRRRHERLAPIVLGGAIVGSVGTLAAAMIAHRSLDGVQPLRPGTSRCGSLPALLPAVALHLLFGLADGRLATPIRRNAVIAGYVIGATIGLVLLADREHLIVWPSSCSGSSPSASACTPPTPAMSGRGRGPAPDAVDRLGHGGRRRGDRRHRRAPVLTDWPDNAGAVALAFTGFVPVGLACGTLPRMVARVDRLLTHTVAIAGLTALVVAIYVVVILGLGRTPSERRTRHCCCCRWSPPASLRCCTCRLGAG